MLLTTDTVVALRCPMCGKFEMHGLSLFAFAGQKTVQIGCSCGATKLILGTKNRKNFWLQVPCVLCETKHMFYYSRKQIWAENVLNIVCSESKIELGYIGSRDKVEILVETYEQDISKLLEEMDPDDFINNPNIMMEVLNCLHDIAEDGYLFCECGNVKIEVDVLPDRLELQCGECEAMGTIYAETQEDLDNIKNMEMIELGKDGMEYWDKTKLSPTGIRKKKKSKYQR